MAPGDTGAGEALDLPTAAVEMISARAEEFVALLEAPPPDLFANRGQSNPDLYARRLKAEDFKSLGSIGQISHLGERLCHFVPSKDGWVGFGPERYPQLRDFADGVAERPEIRPLASAEYVEDTAFSWLAERHAGQLGSTERFGEHLIARLRIACKSHAVTVPLENIYLHMPCHLGLCELKNFEKSRLDVMEAEWRGSGAADDAAISRGMERLRRLYQGRTCCSTTVFAERRRALAVALQRTDDLLMVLRLYSPPIFEPKCAPFFGRVGAVHRPSSEAFVEAVDARYFYSGEADRRVAQWPIDAELLKLMKKEMLEFLANLVQRHDHTDFEQSCISALRHLDRSTTSDDLLDKTVFALAAAETLALRSPTEPVVGTASLRLAVLAGQTATARKNAVQVIKDAHAIRSAYLHHGRKSDDVACVRDLLAIVRAALMTAFVWTQRFSSRDDFFDHVNGVLLSGDANAGAPGG